MKIDDKLDQLLKSQPLHPGNEFTRETLERIHQITGEPREQPQGALRDKAISFPRKRRIMAGKLAAAAILVTGLGAVFLGLEERKTRDTGAQAQSGILEQQRSEQAPASNESLDMMNADSDPITLDDSMGDFEILLDDNSIEVLTLLAVDLET